MEFHPKQITKLTKPEWKELNKKAQWDVLVALRGPDFYHPYSGMLKYLTGGVIRARMWGLLKPEGGSATVNKQLPFTIIPDGQSWKDHSMKGFDWQHYSNHIMEAGAYIGVPRLIVADQFWLKLLQGNADVVGQYLVEYSKQYSGSSYGMPAPLASVVY